MKMYYGWRVVAVSFLSTLLALGTRYAFSVFFVAILAEYHWGRAETAGVFSMAMIAHALSAPMAGTLVDRIGPRRFFPLGALLLGVGMILASFTTKMWHLYVFFGIFMAVGINCLSFAPHMTVIARWFVKKRGLASGLASSGISLGSLIVAPLAQVLIGVAGWRSAFLVFAVFTLLGLIPLLVWIHRRGPEDVGALPDGDEPVRVLEPETAGPAGAKPHRPGGFPGSAPGASVSLALQGRAFWLMAANNLLYGILLNMLVVHQAAQIVGAGFSDNFAAAAVGLVGLFGAVGGIFAGLVSDRIGRRQGYLWASIGGFIGVVCLTLLSYWSSAWLVIGYSVLYGISFGALPTIQGAMYGDLFWGPYMGRIVGLLSVAFGVGGAVGAFLGGWFFDLFHSYVQSFILAFFCGVLGTIALWYCVPPAEQIE